MRAKKITVEQKDFLDNLNNSYHYLHRTLMAWEKLSEEDNDSMGDNFPFPMSFDEWLNEFGLWIETVDKIFNNRYHNFHPTITVGELKKILDDFDDDIAIVTASENGFWWRNIDSVELPDDESMFTITFHTKDTFTTTQLGV